MIDVFSRGAEISPCGNYRYLLTRTMLFGTGACTFVMLNPSTADGRDDDPTIRRCLGFVERWGFQQLRVVNLFAWRATYPEHMFRQLDPVGPDGDGWILRACEDADRIVCAWGAHKNPLVSARAAHVRALIRDAGHERYHLGLSKEGHPRHPLFIRGDAEPQRYPV